MERTCTIEASGASCRPLSSRGIFVAPYSKEELMAWPVEACMDISAMGFTTFRRKHSDIREPVGLLLMLSSFSSSF